jgi:hypothetical protein
MIVKAFATNLRIHPSYNDETEFPVPSGAQQSDLQLPIEPGRRNTGCVHP